MLKNSERKLRPFIAAGIGFSHESNGGGNSNHTLLAFNLGGDDADPVQLQAAGFRDRLGHDVGRLGRARGDHAARTVGLGDDPATLHRRGRNPPDSGCK